MKRFIVYTTEGYTESPTFQEVQNCQVLGEVEAQNEREAIEALFQRELWITECNFSRHAAIAREIV